MPPKKRKALSDLTEEETTIFYELIQRYQEELDEEDDKETIESLDSIATKLQQTRVARSETVESVLRDPNASMGIQHFADMIHAYR
ncbi:hypothetical protein GALMADRAFT_222615 [Galerina marginata CBS 339.88]|uniref:Uncharacterized protein n=1 Tax=Galerina marginata (strain CBS 339.88) TaxID=685588 RepID=A0A067TM96_GALM3|nr:hypothetical protein GALMADRAFT_222615 [Galerina marginata CBS 339.88]